MHVVYSRPPGQFEVPSAPGSSRAFQRALFDDFLGLAHRSGRWTRHAVLQHRQDLHEEHAAVSSTLARLTKERKTYQYLIHNMIRGTYLPSNAKSLRAAECLRSVVESPFLFMFL
jgi:hypothetical protein